MKGPDESQGIGASFLPILEKLPLLARPVRTRGWHYVISWLHRVTGIGLVIGLLVLIDMVSALQTPDLYHAKMKFRAWPIFVFLAWVSSLVLSFHALGGGRLILYELFGYRNDATMVRWTFGLSVSYAAILGLLMIMDNQRASALFFWMPAFFAGVATSYVVASRLWKSRHSVLWKLQRISGAFLFATGPAYLLFLSLNPGVADEAQAATALIQNAFIRIVYLALAVSALYHSGYGLFSIAADYVSSRKARAGIATLIALLIGALALFTFMLILSG